MTAPGFSLSAIPPATLMALGQTFSIPLPEGMTPAAHYDQAMFHLMTYWGGVERDENGVSHLALAMMHTARLMGHTPVVSPPAGMGATMQQALNQGAAFNASSALAQTPPATVAEQPPPPEEKPEEAPPVVPAPRLKMTPDGFVILDYQPGVHLTTDQARERAGVGKSQLARLLQENKFVRPAGVIESPTTGRFNKVYLADEIDTWKLNRNKKSKPISEDHKAKLVEALSKARAGVAELETVDWSHVESGQWWTYEMVGDYVHLSRGWLNKAISDGKFPKAKAKAKKQGGGAPSSLFWPQDVIDWLNRSPDAAFARAARRAADDAKPRTAVDGPAPEFAAVAETAPAVAAEPEPEPAPAAPPVDASGLAALGTVKPKEPTGWMSIRDVADYIGSTETGVERLIKEGKFPQAHKRDARLHTREWGARQVIKWKRDNIEFGALAK